MAIACHVESQPSHFSVVFLMRQLTLDEASGNGFSLRTGIKSFHSHTGKADRASGTVLYLRDLYLNLVLIFSLLATRVGEKGQESKRELSSSKEPFFNQRIRRLDLTDAIRHVNLHQTHRRIDNPNRV